VRLSQQQAIEQLRPLIGSLVDIAYGWDPFNIEADDKNVLQWVGHEDNTWCSGKKYDFELFVELKAEYEVGDYARAVLQVFGIRVK
jgi:hypothetical protein